MFVANSRSPEPQRKKKPAPGKKKSTVSAKKKPKPAGASEPKAHARIGVGEVLRGVSVVLLSLVICFGLVLSVVSFRGEQLQKKVVLSYSGVLQRECLFSIDFEDGQVRNFVESTKRRGQTRAFTFFCNTTLLLNADSMSGYILFGNPAENDCDLVLSIVDENGDLIYRSDGVQPGKYISQIRPFVAPEKGAHVCTAYVSGYRIRDQRYECVGVQYMDLAVEVGGSS